jgi:hypothetical protein
VTYKKPRKAPRRTSGAENTRNRTYGRQWRAVRLRVLERDGYRCQIRGPRCTGGADVVDHVVDARVTGPVFDPENLRAACRSCNTWIAAQRRKRESRAERAPVVHVKDSPRTPCPHGRLSDGSSCPGTTTVPGHWSRWWFGGGRIGP